MSSRTAIDGLLDQMTFAFPDAEVIGYEALIDVMTCDPKDNSNMRYDASTGGVPCLVVTTSTS